MNQLVKTFLSSLAILGLTTASHAVAKTTTLKLSLQHPTEHMAFKSAERVKTRIEKETDGRIKLLLFPANQLGDASQVYEEVMRGSIDLAHITVPDQYDSRLGVGFLPYLARDYDQIRKTLAKGSFVDTKIDEMHTALGVKFFSYYGEGFLGIGTVKPLQDDNKAGASKGVMIRVPGLDVFKFGAEELGFRTTTIPYADVYSALQTGIADGWLGGSPNLNYHGFRDVIKYYYQYNVNFEATQYVMNKKKFNKLSDKDQAIVEKAFIEEGQQSFLLAESEDEMYLKKLQEAGINVITYSTQELEGMANYVRDHSWNRLEKNLTSEIITTLQSSYK